MEASADQERGTKRKVRKTTKSAIRASLGDIVVKIRERSEKN